MWIYGMVFCVGLLCIINDWVHEGVKGFRDFLIRLVAWLLWPFTFCFIFLHTVVETIRASR